MVDRCRERVRHRRQPDGHRGAARPAVKQPASCVPRGWRPGSCSCRRPGRPPSVRAPLGQRPRLAARRCAACSVEHPPRPFGQPYSFRGVGSPGTSAHDTGSAPLRSAPRDCTTAEFGRCSRATPASPDASAVGRPSASHRSAEETIDGSASPPRWHGRHPGGTAGRSCTASVGLPRGDHAARSARCRPITTDCRRRRRPPLTVGAPAPTTGDRTDRAPHRPDRAMQLLPLGKPQPTRSRRRGWV